MSKDNVRIMTSISVDLNNQLTELAKQYGMSKSGLVAYYVGRSVAIETKASSVLDSQSIAMLMHSMSNDLKKF